MRRKSKSTRPPNDQLDGHYLDDHYAMETCWIGGGSRALGLEGRVNKDEFVRALIGQPINQLGDEGEAAW